MAGAHQWAGFDVHGFDGPESLAYSMDNAGHRHAYSVEVCAKLMNGPLYANANPPADDGDHREFGNVVVSDDVYQGMQVAGGVDLGGWLGYKANMLQRTPELPVSSLKVRHNIYLSCHEINGGAKFRRRIFLPPALLEPGAIVYHFLEYKSLPNMEFRERPSVLALRAADAAANDAENVVAPDDVDAQAAAAEDAENVGAQADDGAQAAAGAQIASGVNEIAGENAAAAAEGTAAAAAQATADAAALATDDAVVDVLWQDILQNYHSDSDEDYVPDEGEEGEDHVLRVTHEGTIDD